MFSAGPSATNFSVRAIRQAAWSLQARTLLVMGPITESRGCAHRHVRGRRVQDGRGAVADIWVPLMLFKVAIARGVCCAIRAFVGCSLRPPKRPDRKTVAWSLPAGALLPEV